jgi:hypothetical protein
MYASKYPQTHTDCILGTCITYISIHTYILPVHTLQESQEAPAEHNTNPPNSKEKVQALILQAEDKETSNVCSFSEEQKATCARGVSPPNERKNEQSFSPVESEKASLETSLFLDQQNGQSDSETCSDTKNLSTTQGHDVWTEGCAGSEDQARRIQSASNLTADQVAHADHEKDKDEWQAADTVNLHEPTEACRSHRSDSDQAFRMDSNNGWENFVAGDREGDSTSERDEEATSSESEQERLVLRVCHHQAVDGAETEKETSSSSEPELKAGRSSDGHDSEGADLCEEQKDETEWPEGVPVASSSIMTASDTHSESGYENCWPAMQHEQTEGMQGDQQTPEVQLNSKQALEPRDATTVVEPSLHVSSPVLAKDNLSEPRSKDLKQRLELQLETGAVVAEHGSQLLSHQVQDNQIDPRTEHPERDLSLEMVHADETALDKSNLEREDSPDADHNVACDEMKSDAQGSQRELLAADGFGIEQLLFLEGVVAAQDTTAQKQQEMGTKSEERSPLIRLDDSGSTDHHALTGTDLYNVSSQPFEKLQEVQPHDNAQNMHQVTDEHDQSQAEIKVAHSDELQDGLSAQKEQLLLVTNQGAGVDFTRQSQEILIEWDLPWTGIDQDKQQSQDDVNKQYKDNELEPKPDYLCLIHSDMVSSEETLTSQEHVASPRQELDLLDSNFTAADTVNKANGQGGALQKFQLEDSDLSLVDGHLFTAATAASVVNATADENTLEEAGEPERRDGAHDTKDTPPSFADCDRHASEATCASQASHTSAESDSQPSSDSDASQASDSFQENGSVQGHADACHDDNGDMCASDVAQGHTPNTQRMTFQENPGEEEEAHCTGERQNHDAGNVGSSEHAASSPDTDPTAFRGDETHERGSVHAKYSPREVEVTNPAAASAFECKMQEQGNLDVAAPTARPGLTNQASASGVYVGAPAVEPNDSDVAHAQINQSHESNSAAAGAVTRAGEEQAVLDVEIQARKLDHMQHFAGQDLAGSVLPEQTSALSACPDNMFHDNAFAILSSSNAILPEGAHSRAWPESHDFVAEFQDPFSTLDKPTADNDDAHARDQSHASGFEMEFPDSFAAFDVADIHEQHERIQSQPEQGGVRVLFPNEFSIETEQLWGKSAAATTQPSHPEIELVEHFPGGNEQLAIDSAAESGHTASMYSKEVSNTLSMDHPELSPASAIQNHFSDAKDFATDFPDTFSTEDRCLSSDTVTPNQPDQSEFVTEFPGSFSMDTKGSPGSKSASEPSAGADTDSMQRTPSVTKSQGRELQANGGSPAQDQEAIEEKHTAGLGKGRTSQVDANNDTQLQHARELSHAQSEVTRGEAGSAADQLPAVENHESDANQQRDDGPEVGPSQCAFNACAQEPLQDDLDVGGGTEAQSAACEAPHTSRALSASVGSAEQPTTSSTANRDAPPPDTASAAHALSASVGMPHKPKIESAGRQGPPGRRPPPPPPPTAARSAAAKLSASAPISADPDANVAATMSASDSRDGAGEVLQEVCEVQVSATASTDVQQASRGLAYGDDDRDMSESQRIVAIAYEDLVLGDKAVSSSPYKLVFRGQCAALRKKLAASGSDNAYVAVIVHKANAHQPVPTPSSLLTNIKACERVGYHAHIAPLLAVCVRPPDGDCCLVMEYAAKGSLDRVLQDLALDGGKTATSEVLLTVAAQVRVVLSRLCLCVCVRACVIVCV